MQEYDLIIVGGGLVGASLALALSDSALKIALIDARSKELDDPRLFALSSSSCQFLKNIKIWPELISQASPIHQIQVSQQHHFGVVRLRREDAQLPELGYVIPAQFIEKSLNEALKKNFLKTHDYYRPAKLNTITKKEDKTILSIEIDGQEKKLSAAFIVGADGVHSKVRSEFNIDTEEYDYQQIAIVTKTTLQRAHQHIAYERFTHDGVIAMLPLVSTEQAYQCATIWTSKKQKAKTLLEMPEEEFLAHLQKAFGYRLGRLKKISQRFTFPLKMVRAKQMTKDNVFLLGNAAHTLNPIAAQGFNLALYEAAVLAESIITQFKQGECASAQELENLSAQMKTQQKMSLRVTHLLSKFFSQSSPLLKAGVQISLLSLEMMPLLKKNFIHHMMAMGGRVPPLLLESS